MTNMPLIMLGIIDYNIVTEPVNNSTANQVEEK